MDDKVREAADDLLKVFHIRRKAKRIGDHKTVKECGAIAAAICTEYPEAIKLHAKNLADILKEQDPDATQAQIDSINQKVSDIYKIAVEKHNGRLH